MDQSPRTHDVFLSHSAKDKRWADGACAILEKHGIRCWIAPRDITPGEEWGASIISGLNTCRVMVLIFSGHADASAQVRREVERSINRGMPLIPFRIEDIHPTGAMEFALGNTHWLDAFAPPVEQKLEMLAQTVKTLLGNPSGPQPPMPPLVPETPPKPQPTPAPSANENSVRRETGVWKPVLASAITVCALILGFLAWQNIGKSPVVPVKVQNNDDAKLNGTWEWVVNRGGASTKHTIKFVQKGDVLTGVEQTPNAENVIKDGKVDKNGQATWSIGRAGSNGDAIPSKYKGIVEGDLLKVQMVVVRKGIDRSFDFEAKRVKE